MDAYKELAACKRVLGGFACDEEARSEIFVIRVVAKVWICPKAGNGLETIRSPHAKKLCARNIDCSLTLSFTQMMQAGNNERYDASW